MKLDLLTGFSIALTIFIGTIIEYLLGWHTPENIRWHLLSGYIAYIIPIIAIWIAFNHKKKVMKLDFDFMKALQSGIFISFITGISAVLFHLLYTAFINPTYYQNAIEGIALLNPAHKSEAILVYNRKTQISQILAQYLFFGSFVGLVIGYFYTRKK